ncbi:MAG: Na+/H+ antiporter NhaC, partial [Tissierellales bacterium]
MSKQVRKPYIYEAIITFLFLVGVMAVGIAKYEMDPHIPMLIGAAFAALMALRLGYSWRDIEEGMIQGITQALQSVMILAIIGVLIGVWLLSGVVPSMIYYGLNIISPSIFLVATLIICSITSLATGTSWGTMGTVGVAGMGIGMSMGIPAPMIAGAVISGAYFGDKMSPLSDTTNLASGLTGTDLYDHIKNMFYTTIPGIIIA